MVEQTFVKVEGIPAFPRRTFGVLPITSCLQYWGIQYQLIIDRLIASFKILFPHHVVYEILAEAGLQMLCSIVKI